MKRETIVAMLASIPADAWNSLSKQMAWAYRKESDVAPRALTASVGIKGLPSREDWAVLRKDVLAERRRHEYQRKKKLVEQRAESRRDYMRAYMRSYRRSRD